MGQRLKQRIGGEQARVGRHRLMQRPIFAPGDAACVEGGFQRFGGAAREGSLEQREEAGAAGEAGAFILGEADAQFRFDRLVPSAATKSRPKAPNRSLPMRGRSPADSTSATDPRCDRLDAARSDSGTRISAPSPLIRRRSSADVIAKAA